MQMNAARALEIEKEMARQIPAGFYKVPEDMEHRRDRLAYSAMKAVQEYRKCLLAEEAARLNDLDCGHDVCTACGAHLDHGEKCDCGT